MDRSLPPPLALVLRVVRGCGQPEALPLQVGSCTIGAGAEADLLVEDPAVSRRHVRLTVVPEGVQVEDLDSHNGTFLLGQRIDKAVLAPGSRITVGATEIAIEPDHAALLESSTDEERYGGLLGRAPAVRKLFGMMIRLEGSLVNVLIEGESGVGKELVARAIHEGSVLAGGPLVVLNCGAVAPELVLSQLFGHEKGAFTGATEAREGVFQAADGGTLFLDEIGELPLDAQASLLRALESGEITPVGATQTQYVKVRLLAATNRTLRDEVKTGGFREDLYYRLAVIAMRVPPLRERTEDIAVLAEHFARQASAAELPDELVAELVARSWPGNVRELKNAVLSYLTLGALPTEAVTGDELLVATMAQAVERAVDEGRDYHEQKELFTTLFSHAYLEALLARAGGNRSEAARLGGMSRTYLVKLLAKYQPEDE